LMTWHESQTRAGRGIGAALPRWRNCLPPSAVISFYSSRLCNRDTAARKHSNHILVNLCSHFGFMGAQHSGAIMHGRRLTALNFISRCSSRKCIRVASVHGTL
jgi:hypothetical protein